jgi:hypothetical protein
MHFLGAYDAGTAYVTYDVVTYSNTLYLQNQATSTGDTPPGTTWTIIGEWTV